MDKEIVVRGHIEGIEAEPATTMNELEKFLNSDLNWSWGENGTSIDVEIDGVTEVNWMTAIPSFLQNTYKQFVFVGAENENRVIKTVRRGKRMPKIEQALIDDIRQLDAFADAINMA